MLFDSWFQAFRSWGQCKEMSAEQKTVKGWDKGQEQGTSLSLSLPLFLLYFFPTSLTLHCSPLPECLEQASVNMTICNKCCHSRIRAFVYLNI